MSERSPKQREASRQNAAKAAAVRRAKANGRRDAHARAVHKAYASAVASLELAFQSESINVVWAKRSLAELARIAAGPHFDNARHKAIASTIRDACALFRP